jgi:hypothetical protein
MVQLGEAIHGDYQILINDIATRQAHGSTLFPEFARKRTAESKLIKRLLLKPI